MQLSNQSLRQAVVFSGLLMLSLAVHADTYEIDAMSWQQPRSASMVKALPAVQSAIKTFLSRPEARLVIRHRDDEEGSLWGAELRDWLVSLGIPPSNMRLEVMNLESSVLQLQVSASGVH